MHAVAFGMVWLTEGFSLFVCLFERPRQQLLLLLIFMKQFHVIISRSVDRFDGGVLVSTETQESVGKDN